MRKYGCVLRCSTVCAALQLVKCIHVMELKWENWDKIVSWISGTQQLIKRLDMGIFKRILILNVKDAVK